MINHYLYNFTYFEQATNKQEELIVYNANDKVGLTSCLLSAFRTPDFYQIIALTLPTFFGDIFCTHTHTNTYLAIETFI